MRTNGKEIKQTIYKNYSLVFVTAFVVGGALEKVFRLSTWMSYSRGTATETYSNILFIYDTSSAAILLLSHRTLLNFS